MMFMSNQIFKAQSFFVTFIFGTIDVVCETRVNFRKRCTEYLLLQDVDGKQETFFTALETKIVSFVR